MMDWFPQQYAAEFNWIKALIAMVAAIMLILHMTRIWSRTPSLAQRLRFIILLGYACLTVYSSATLARSSTPVKMVNVLTLIITAGLIGVVVQSMREWDAGVRNEV